MASSTHYFSFRYSLLLYLVLFLFTSSLLVSAMLDEDTQGEKPKKKTILSPSKNQTKLIKPTTIKTSNSNSNSTKSSNTGSTTLPKTISKKLNSTKSSNITTTLSKSLFKKLNSTSNSTKLITKSSDLSKLNTPKNKTQSITTKQTQKPLKPLNPLKSEKPQKAEKLDWMDIDVNEDFIAEFRDLPQKFHQTFIPDLEKFSLSSKAYMSKANKEISEGFRPLVGKHYAPTIASVLSCVFILIPLLLVSLIFNKIKSYFPLQTILTFIQVYLSIYFFILALAALITGLEPLKFFYATSLSSYVCLQVLQTLGYVLFLLLLLMNLVLVFSTETGIGSKVLGLGQTLLGCAVGLHYYVAVFHRAVLYQPPKTNWKVHGVYATCFLVICLLARAERRKKAYLEFGGEEGKKS